MISLKWSSKVFEKMMISSRYTIQIFHLNPWRMTWPGFQRKWYLPISCWKINGAIIRRRGQSVSCVIIRGKGYTFGGNFIQLPIIQTNPNFAILVGNENNRWRPRTGRWLNHSGFNQFLNLHFDEFFSAGLSDRFAFWKEDGRELLYDAHSLSLWTRGWVSAERLHQTLQEQEPIWIFPPRSASKFQSLLLLEEQLLSGCPENSPNVLSRWNALSRQNLKPRIPPSSKYSICSDFLSSYHNLFVKLSDG